ncbi:MAG: ParB/RepB/Spo0J family partition protein [Clostridia bacterium]|nr:ParB/RepB/Spo0J family partition protein [Clostridia bacterium]
MKKSHKKGKYPEKGAVLLIPIADIRPNPSQPRRDFPLDSLMELAQSISENGILQPLTISMEGGEPTLIAGERRLRAARIAGLREVPCVQVQAEARQRQVLTLIENLQRQDMNCFEEAQGIRHLIDSFELTQCEAAHQLGMSQSAVANKLRLLRLPEDERRALIEGGFGERHARALLRLTDRTRRLQVMEKMVADKLTVAQTERLVEEILAGRVRRKPSKPLIRDVRVFFNTVNHALSIMRRGGIPAESTQREEGDYIEYVVRIPKQAASRG